jgi:predicted thioredoxin/glutaredoxin
VGMVLKIYTMRHCLTCETTRTIASQISERCPWLLVELIHLDDPGATIPPNVFSVPTYVLDGKVIALGNPYLEHLEATICHPFVR